MLLDKKSRVKKNKQKYNKTQQSLIFCKKIIELIL